MAEFRLTPAALRDLEGIWLYTVQHWGAAQATHYLDVLNTSFEALARSPTLAPATTTSGPDIADSVSKVMPSISSWTVAQ